MKSACLLNQVKDFAYTKVGLGRLTTLQTNRSAGTDLLVHAGSFMRLLYSTVAVVQQFRRGLHPDGSV